MRGNPRRFPRVPDAFELLIAYLCVVAGLPLALGAPPPNSIQRILPSWLVHCWGATLFIGGVLIVLGLALRRGAPGISRLLVGLRIEQAGLLPMAAGAAVFSLVITVAAGWPGVFAGGTYLMFAAACLLRTVEVRDTARGIDQAVQRSRDRQ